MFSVEDLLISHGYKLSKTPTSLYESRGDGYPPEVAEKSTNGTLNGFPTKSGAYTCVKKPTTRSFPNDNESSYVNQGQQPSYHQNIWSLANTHASERRFYDQPQLAASSHPKTDKDLAYWRRRGQDFSVLFGYTDRGESEMKGIAAPRALHGHDKESQWEAGGGTERMRATGLQENWKPPGDYRWQSLRAEGWNPPTKLGRLLSDSDRERLLQDSYSGRHGETTVASRHKGKSQSLPRVLSPESLRSVEMPSLANNLSLSRTKTTSCPQTGLAREASKRLEPAAPFLPLPKPKYGRPLKPPSYELHRQTRGILEPALLQDGQQKDEAVSLTKGNEPSQDACSQDSCLEPPVYIPPPCYKSPAQQSLDQHLPSKVPEYDVCFDNGLQHPVERAILRFEPPMSDFGTSLQHCKDEQISQDKKRHRKHVESYLSSVQYIPFDDPRIRHIQVARADSLQEGANRVRDANRISPCAFQESALELEYDSAFLEMSDLLSPSAVKCNRVSDSSVHSSRWSAESNVNQDSDALPIQRNCYDTDNDTSHKYPQSRPLAQSPPTEPPGETVTKIKAFEPGTAVQSRRSSKKKMNETIFCLVSVPVKSELNLPDTDRNNNLTRDAEEKNGLDNSGALQEQSLLSTSSTDLELQALTGNMTNKNELQKQELWKPELKQMNDLRLLQPAKHKELQYSGSWPGDQYKDQQTQTSFTEEPKLMPLSHSLRPIGSSKGTATQWLRNAGSTTESVTLATLTAGDRKNPQDAYREKGEVDCGPSSSRVCSRTAVLAPKACHNIPPCASCASFPGQEKGTGSVVREEASTACSSKELFGQFLLKPVGRRPWDVISELESFNKELQEQEERSEDGVGNEGNQKRGEEKEGSPGNGTCRTEGMSQDCRPTEQSETDMLVAPVFQKVREKSKAEHLSRSESLSAWVGSDLHSDARTQSGLQAQEVGESGRPANGYVAAEPRKQEVGERITKQAMTPCLITKALLDSYSGENHYNPFNGISSRETAQVKNHRDCVIDFDRIKNNTVPWNDLALERGPGVHLSLTDRNHGLSEPDLRSVGLESSHVPSTEKNDGYGKLEVTEIPLNESLQARAARILGIEVAVESLVPESRALQDEHFHSDKAPETLRLSAERTLGSKREAEITSFEGRRKCGWTESSLFTGDRNVMLGSVENPISEQEDVLDTPSPFDHHKGLDRQGENQPLFLESVVLPFSERHLVQCGAEKKARSTSKVIETLQGKLASPPSRAAVDRLVRMKEVDSVSRMRRLSIKNADSVEDGDEQTKGVEERGSYTTSGSNEPARKMSHGSSVSKRIISLAENGLGLLDNLNDRKTGRDLFCLDAYDPTRVERV